MKLVEKISDSFIIQFLITCVTYMFYAGILGISFFPSVYLLVHEAKILLLPAFYSGIDILNILFFSFFVGISIYIFFITGLVLMGVIIRIFTIGIKPGRYPAISGTTVKWLIYSGIYTLAVSLILPVVPMTFFSNLFFNLIGCRIGKNVKLNTWMLNDSYLLEIGNNVVIGGQTDISCHIFENNHLILKRIYIGDNTLIGAHCYISPGVRIGKNCIIGLNSYIRTDRVVPDGTILSVVSSMPMKEVVRIEKNF